MKQLLRFLMIILIVMMAFGAFSLTGCSNPTGLGSAITEGALEVFGEIYDDSPDAKPGDAEPDDPVDTEPDDPGDAEPGDPPIIEPKIEMVLIPAGSFQMGSLIGEAGSISDERPRHSVTLTRGFYMGKYAVTEAQYLTVMQQHPGAPKGGSYPAHQLSWYDAIAFCNTLSMMEGLDPAYSIAGSTDPADWGDPVAGNAAAWNAAAIISNADGYRLPTEAQWEYACRAGASAAYNTGSNTISNTTGWYYLNAAGGNTPHPVGQLPPNAWLLHDMHGNVNEWCWDRYSATYSSAAATDPVGPASGAARVFRGGDYTSKAALLRSASRGSAAPSASQHGLRVVRLAQ